MTTNELTCQQLVELITDYVEGVLPPAERLQFEQHLAICSGCRTYLDQMQQVIWALGRAAGAELSPDERTLMLDLFRDWKREQGSTDS